MDEENFLVADDLDGCGVDRLCTVSGAYAKAVFDTRRLLRRSRDPDDTLR